MVSVISEDLKFKLYKAEFASTSGIVYFNNPSLSVGSTYTSADANIPHLVNNPIKTLPRKLIVGMSTSQALGTILVPGVKVAEGDNNGIIEFVGGNVGTVGISTVGVGYSNGTLIMSHYILFLVMVLVQQQTLPSLEMV